jgi:outer membrane protein TolC
MSMSWEIDIWGRIRRSNEAARATLFATAEPRRGVWLTLVSDLAQAYFQLLALDVQLQIAQNSTQTYQGTYDDLFRDRFNLGVASKLETLRALGNAQATIPQLQSAIAAREKRSASCWARRPARFRVATRCTRSPWRRRRRRGCPRLARATAGPASGGATARGRERPRRSGEGGVLSQTASDRAVRGRES